MSDSDSEIESASENTRLMDAHVSRNSGGADPETQARRGKSRSETSNHVNYGSVRRYFILFL